MKKTLSIISAALLLASCADKNPVLTVEGGQLQGVKGELPGVTVYKGVPFAAAPVGDLRWKAPQPVTPWEGVKVADTYGAPCIQAAHTPGGYTPEFFWEGDPEFSEDCLYLNVFTKYPGKTGKKLPVAMWIHGGGYTAGWGFEPEMDGEEWAGKDVVLVTINYRLGMFGFMTHPELAAESEAGVSGNYGILDQIAALKWIKNNIAQFGGDPDNVTIIGQSAGAGSVKTLCESPLTDGLFNKAVIQSGGGISDRPALGGANADSFIEPTAKFMEWAGAESVNDLRKLSDKELYALVGKYQAETRAWSVLCTRPVLDGYVSNENFDQAAVSDKIKKIPYLIGFTMNDMGSLGDGIGRFCLNREELGGQAWAYQFARPLPDNGEENILTGAFHSSELWYMFKSLRKSWRPFTEEDYKLAEKMLTGWSNFVKFGNPNGKSGNAWPAYTQANPEYMVFKLDENGKEASAMGQPVK